MAVVGEDILFKITVDAAQAKREAEATSKSVTTLNGTLNKLDAGTREAQKVLNGLGDTMGGTKGKTLQFVGVIGDLAGAMASGGKFAVAAIAATYTIGKLAEAYNEAKVNGNAFKDAMPAIAASIKTLRDQALEPGRQAVKDFATELANFGKDARQIAIDNQEAIAKGMAMRSSGLSTSYEVQFGKVNELRRTKGKDSDEYKTAFEILKSIVERQNSLAVARDIAEKDLAALKEIDKALDAKEKARDARDKAAREAKKDDVVTGDSDRTDSDSLHAQIAAIEEVNTRLQSANADRGDMEQALADRIKAINLKAKNDRIMATLEANEAIAKSYDQLYGDIASGSLNNFVGVAQGFFNDLASGQEHAAERATAAFLTATGSQLVGIGTKAVIEGAIISSNPLTPGAGLPMMGLGALAIGTGITMGAGGAAITANLPDSSASRPMLDRSVNGGSRGGGSRDSGGGGPIVYVQNFGVAGPSPDEAARAVGRLERRGRDRGFSDDSVRRGR